MADVESLPVRRSFAWGVFVIADRDGTQPMPTTVGESGIAASDPGVSVRVRHADDTDAGSDRPAEVTLNLSVGGTPSQSAHAHQLEVSSGVLSIGDADAMHEIAVTPGRWTVSVALDNAARAETVDIWLTRDERA